MDIDITIADGVKLLQQLLARDELQGVLDRLKGEVGTVDTYMGSRTRYQVERAVKMLELDLKHAGPIRTLFTYTEELRDTIRALAVAQEQLKTVTLFLARLKKKQYPSQA